ncbi:hypothetical protein HW555_013029 [Spodoptera exigua]|uniref:Uncharacterized protein n=1 Tax=Spodoptera exigua TaxID=7107 RepID=A0A835KZ19_SPOEX|nr:hypothetical protein HW555_013029 [Spodoptera exigua]
MKSLFPLLVCVSLAQTAPQQNSNITYIKPLEPTQPELKSTERESRIENVALTIPAEVETELKNSSKTNFTQPIYNYSDRIYSIKNKPKSTTTTEIIPSTEDIKETSNETSKPEENISEQKDSDIEPAESQNSDRISDEAETERTETEPTVNDETVTEKSEEDATVTTEIYEETTTRLPTPRLLPKLSYYGKPSSGSFSQNLIPIPGKRRFRSRCRCEKIWNCAKLQISVPRCPEEYFMCCT